MVSLGKTLQGRIAIVVGGVAPGGLCVARKLAGEGAIVILADLDDTESVATADRLSAEGFTVQGMGIDVNDPDSVDAAFDLVANTYGTPDLTCYGVGFHLSDSLHVTSSGLWKHGILTNLGGAWLCARAFVRRLRPLRTHAAALIYLLSEWGGATNDSLTEITLAGASALARHVTQAYSDLGVRACALVSGPLPGSGAERVLRQMALREGLVFEEFIERCRRGGGYALSTNPQDVATAVLNFIHSQLRTGPECLYRIVAGDASPQRS